MRYQAQGYMQIDIRKKSIKSWNSQSLRYQAQRYTQSKSIKNVTVLSMLFLNIIRLWTLLCSSLIWKSWNSQSPCAWTWTHTQKHTKTCMHAHTQQNPRWTNARPLRMTDGCWQQEPNEEAACST